MNATAPQRERLAELDALRGLAALSVVFCHFLHIFPATGNLAAVSRAARVAEHTPLAIAFAGHEAVILFFILSGFVLSLPWLEGRSVNYGAYLVRRVFRIYVPYLCSAIVAIAAAALLYSGIVGGLSEWFNRVWAAPVTFRSVLDHVLFLGSFANAQFNPVYWSLVHEMRVSLVFPFVALFMLRLDWKWTLAAAVLVSGVGAVLNKIAGAGTDWFASIHYLAFFMVGHLLAKHRVALGEMYRQLPVAAAVAMFAVGVGCYVYGKLLQFIVLQDWAIAVGATTFVLLSLNSARVKSFLNLKPVRFLGDISYSLYLWHAVVLVASVHLLHGTLPPGAVLTVALVASMLLAAASHYWVELPAIRAGKKLAALCERRSSRPPAMPDAAPAAAWPRVEESRRAA